MAASEEQKAALETLARISHGTDFLGGVRFLAQLVMEVH
jgi:hypothetical protein